MDGSVLKKTRESLGKVIKKPPLTDKLLSKPPFRFLHDIITEVIRTTGFMKGLYTDTEMKSENVKERDSKMAFLQKAIDVVAMVTGETLSAKPARIVAGQEPERTNQLLQAIAICCLNKMSSEDAVRRVLSGDKAESKPKASGIKPSEREEAEPVRSEEKNKRTKAEETKDRKKNGESDSRKREQRVEEKESKDRRERRERLEGKEKTHSADRERDRDRREEREKEREKDKREEREKEKERDRREEREKEKERDRREEREKEKERDRREERERDRREGREKDRERDRHREKDREKDKEMHRREEREKEREKERERRRRDRDRDQDRDQARARPKPGEDDAETQVKTEEVPQNISSDDPPRATTESSARIPRPSSAKGQRRRAPVGSQDESDSEGDAATKPPEPSTETAPPVSTSEAQNTPRRTVRPSSARPAPPRAKKQDSHSEPPPERLSSAKSTAVILDAPRAEEEQNDEDEQFLVQEAVTTATENPDLDSMETDGDAAHGGLVKKILETKKYYEVSPSSPKTEVVPAQSQEKDPVHREIERLRNSVQMVCRSALPLGKIMDYIQEDVDAMVAELNGWRDECRVNNQALEREYRLTEEALQPLHSELAALDQMIQEKQTQICALRSSVLRNDEKIQRMLTGLHHGDGT